MPVVRFSVNEQYSAPSENRIYCDMERDFLPCKGETFVAHLHALEVQDVVHRDAPNEPKYEVQMRAHQDIINIIKTDPVHKWIG